MMLDRRATLVVLAVCVCTGVAGTGLHAGAQARLPAAVPTQPTSVAPADEGVTLSGNDVTVTTLPEQAPAPTSDDTPTPEVLELAESTGRPVEEIAAVLEAQGAMSAVVTPLRQEEWFVDFMFTPEGTTGALLTEPGAAKLGQAAVAALDVEVVEAVLDRSQRALAVETATVAAQERLAESYLGTSYDAFQNIVTVFATPGSAAAREAATPITAAVSAAGLSSTPSVEIDTTNVGSGVRGGQYADHRQTDEWCTTGFGIWTGNRTSYLIAGHCGIPTPNFSINGNTQTSFSGRVFTEYLDRQAINAPGATWMVRISPTIEVDMEATAGHIFLNEIVCRFGQTSQDLDCGTVSAVNAPVAQSNGTFVHASVVDATVCRGGDSGGPVWITFGGTRWPKGLVSGKTFDNGRCMLVALDDQLVGTGWSLL